MKNLWEVWPSALSDQYCDYIIEKAKKHQPQDATVGFEGNNREDTAYRSSTIRWLDVLGADADISETLMRYAKKSNRNNFGFDITTMNEIQFTEYHAPHGKYGWHYDTYWENEAPYDRKLSIVCQLSHPDEYEGAQFEFFNTPSPGEEWSRRGSILIFPSFFWHQVRPITKGSRYSLVTWIDGPKWR
jgi:PKHD-type hydroxylase